MGSYGIGISRLVVAIIEAYHDDLGIIWPSTVSPFQLSLVNLMPENKMCMEMSNKLYKQLLQNNIEVLYDDREVGMGKKLSDYDLIGFPYQIIIGANNLKENLVEIKTRQKNIVQKLSPEEAMNFITKQLSPII